MKKTYLTTALTLVLAMGFTSCSSEADENVESTDNTEVTENQEEPKEEEIEEVESPLGYFSDLVGEWTVDAATAGIKMDLTFNEDGSFNQKMGEINADGTWEVAGEKSIKVTTPNAKDGQTWLVSNLTETSVDICWNPDNPNPKTLPMERVK